MSSKLRLLVGCEFSGTVRDAFARRGWDAYSCDFLPSEKPGKHLQRDVRRTLCGDWDLAIFHPDCTYLTTSAEWALKDPDYIRYPDVGYHQRLKPETLFGEARRQARRQAVAFFLTLWNSPVSRICIENPPGHMAQHLPDATRQIIQPWEFGHPESKATCLWLKGLPLLQATNILPLPPSGRWNNQSASGQNNQPESKDRWKNRARTYAGIAEAMSLQYTEFIKNQ